MPTIASLFLKYGSCFNGDIIDTATKTMTEKYEHTETHTHTHISLSLWLDIRSSNARNCKSIVAWCCWITFKANVFHCSVHSLDEHKSEQIRNHSTANDVSFYSTNENAQRAMWEGRDGEWIHHQTSIDIQTFMFKINRVRQNMFALWFASKCTLNWMLSSQLCGEA